MTSALFGNATAEKVLLYLANYGEGYAYAVAQTFGLPQSQVAKQLARLEEGGLLVARTIGKSRVYSFNPRYALKEELLALLHKQLRLLPKETLAKYYRQRRRPRRPGKPL